MDDHKGLESDKILAGNKKIKYFFVIKILLNKYINKNKKIIHK